jgi:ABC-type transporter Mla maintaining outer membrane lipid asymmetry ATPase subunit MlaF
MPEAAQNDPVIELVEASVPRTEAAHAAPVANKVNWTIQRGSFWAVGGFAGSGKTDLLLTAGGLQRPLGGDVRLFGRSISAMSEEELVENRLKVAMVFTNGRLFGHLTISENIALPLNYHAAARGAVQDKVAAALQRVGIADLADKLPRQVPRSLHQRIALARALALSPEVLLIDNPLVGIDQRNTRWWMDFLCAVHVGDPALGRLTLVIATDDYRPWMDSAKQFAVLQNRHLEIVGGRAEATEAPPGIVRDLLTGAFS